MDHFGARFCCVLLPHLGQDGARENARCDCGVALGRGENTESFKISNRTVRLAPNISRDDGTARGQEGYSEGCEVSDVNVFSTINWPVFAALHRVRKRIEEHNQLVYEVAAEHKIEDISTLQPEHLHQFTMLREFDHYIETLKARSMPPPSWLQALSMRRFRR